MTRDEAKVFKHYLTDYNFYKRKIAEMKSRVNDIYCEFGYPSIRLGENRTCDVFADRYATDRFESLMTEISELENRISLYSGIVEMTDRLLATCSDEVRSMLVDIYIKGRSPHVVASEHFYSDDKSMYRVIRKALK